MTQPDPTTQNQAPASSTDTTTLPPPVWAQPPNPSSGEPNASLTPEPQPANASALGDLPQPSTFAPDSPNVPPDQQAPENPPVDQSLSANALSSSWGTPPTAGTGDTTPPATVNAPDSLNAPDSVNAPDSLNTPAYDTQAPSFTQNLQPIPQDNFPQVEAPDFTTGQDSNFSDPNTTNLPDSQGIDIPQPETSPDIQTAPANTMPIESTVQDPNLPPSQEQPPPPFPTVDGPQDLSTPPGEPSQVPPTQEQAHPTEGNGLTPATLESTRKFPLKKILIIVLALIVLIGGAILLFSLFSGKGSTPETSQDAPITDTGATTNLTYWGLWELDNTLQAVIDEYEAQNPDISIEYVRQSHRDYRERLQSEILTGNGPDIFRYHNTWVPMISNILAAEEGGLIDLSDFYSVIQEDVTVSGQIYGVPLMIDTLALYYNPRLLQEANVTVPSTWIDLQDAARKIRVPAATNQPIQIGGIAMGSINNVEHASDIMGLLLLQNQADPAMPDECSQTNNAITGSPDCWGQDALLFYNSFLDDGVWDTTLPQATFAFATEKVAMMIAPSWRAFEIAEINPDLEFATAPVPQLTNTKVAWATYWVEGVSRESANQEEAWKFLNYMSQPDTLTKLHTAQSQVRMFGELYPRKSMASSLINDEIAGAFIEQAEYAQSWYMASLTHGQGINQEIIKYYEDAYNAVNEGNSRYSEVLPTVTQGVTNTLTKYGIDTSQ